MARDINLGPTSGPFVNVQENSGSLDVTTASGTQYQFAESPANNIDVARLQDVNDGEVIKKKEATIGIDGSQTRRETFTFTDLDDITVVSLTLNVQSTGNTGEITYSESADPSSSTVDFVYSKYLNSDVSPEEIGVDITGTSTSNELLNANVVLIYI